MSRAAPNSQSTQDPLIEVSTSRLTQELAARGVQCTADVVGGAFSVGAMFLYGAVRFVSHGIVTYGPPACDAACISAKAVKDVVGASIPVVYDLAREASSVTIKAAESCGPVLESWMNAMHQDDVKVVEVACDVEIKEDEDGWDIVTLVENPSVTDRVDVVSSIESGIVLDLSKADLDVNVVGEVEAE